MHIICVTCLHSSRQNHAYLGPVDNKSFWYALRKIQNFQWPAVVIWPIYVSFFLQALFQMLEKEVTLQCRKADEQLVRSLLPECLDELHKQWGERTEVYRYFLYVFYWDFTFLICLWRLHLYVLRIFKTKFKASSSAESRMPYSTQYRNP